MQISGEMEDLASQNNIIVIDDSSDLPLLSVLETESCRAQLDLPDFAAPPSKPSVQGISSSASRLSTSTSPSCMPSATTPSSSSFAQSCLVTPQSKRTAKKRKNIEAYNGILSSVSKQLTDLENTPVQEHSKPFDLFGLWVADQMRSMPEDQSIEFERIINTFLYLAKVKKLTAKHNLIES